MVPEGIDKNMFFQNRECDYFPCHEGIPEERFNCMPCYCPLYALGRACGGNFVYNEKGYKNCKWCNIPHNGDDGMRMVKSRYKEIAALAAEKPQEESPLS